MREIPWLLILCLYLPGPAFVRAADAFPEKSGRPLTESANLPAPRLASVPDDMYWDHSLSNAHSGFNGPVHALAVWNDMFIAAGRFTTAGDVVVNHVAAWDGEQWLPLGDGLSGLNVDAWTMTVHEGKLIVGGTFNQAGSVPALNIAAWDGEEWSPLGSGISAYLGDMAVYRGELIVTVQSGIGLYGSLGRVLTWREGGWSTLKEGQWGDYHVGGYGDMVVFNDRLFVDHIYRNRPDLDWVGFQPPDNSAIDSWDGVEWTQLAYSQARPVPMATCRDHLVTQLWDVVCGWGCFYTPRIAEWNGVSWTVTHALDDVSDYSPVGSFVEYNRQLIIGAAPLYRWNGHSLATLGSGIDSTARVMMVFRGDLIVGGDFTMAGGQVAPYIARWTKKDTTQVAVDIQPGSCTKSINDNERASRAKAVVSVAIMGSVDLDVHDIDPASIAIEGASPVRWSYGDAGSPADKSDDSCACSEAGPDGYPDITLKFYRSELLDALSHDSNPRRTAFARAYGQFTDGSPFEGFDCVPLVGKHGAGATADDATPRNFELRDNVPNPFNASTIIRFYLPEAMNVRLEVFNVLGQQVATLIDRMLDAGEQSVIWHADGVASGVFYYRIEAGPMVATRQMVLLK